MVFETIALSVITILLILLMLTRKAGWVKLFLALLSAVSAIASMVLFILMQHAGGTPDAGQGLVQMYAPCGIYILAALFSLVMAAFSRHKLRKDKTAKEAAKAAAKAEKAAEKETVRGDS